VAFQGGEITEIENEKGDVFVWGLSKNANPMEIQQIVELTQNDVNRNEMLLSASKLAWDELSSPNMVAQWEELILQIRR